MPRALSNSALPCSVIVPSSGRSRPAIACNVRLLPAPDGPNSTTRCEVALKATSSVKRRSALWKVLRMSTASSISTRLQQRVLRHETPREQQDHDARHRGHEHEEIRGAVIAGLHG